MLTVEAVWMRTDFGADAERMRTADAERMRTEGNRNLLKRMRSGKYV